TADLLLGTDLSPALRHQADRPGYADDHHLRREGPGARAHDRSGRLVGPGRPRRRRQAVGREAGTGLTLAAAHAQLRRQSDFGPADDRSRASAPDPRKPRTPDA